MLAYTLYGFFGGYALFLLGFAVFMYFEGQKFGDNQFTMKLLPPPPRLERELVDLQGGAFQAGAVQALSATADWTPVPARASVPVYPSGRPSIGKTLVRDR